MSSPLLSQLPAKARAAAEQFLEPDEHVLRVFRGKSKQGMVLTDRRLIVVKAGLMSGAGSGAKVAAYPFDQIEKINIYDGRGVAVLELVVPNEAPPTRNDLRAAYQRPNWLPCEKTVGRSPLIAELRTFVESGGRSRSARAALTDDGA